MRTIRGSLTVLIACLLAVVATGCGTTSSSPQGTWIGPEDTRLELAADGTVTGSDGCNHLGGSWSQDGEDVVFSQMMSTLMACTDVNVWLVDPRTATIEGDTMHVFDAGGTELGELHRS